MSTNCSRTSFCDYSAGRTKSVFYTAAVLHRERRQADQIPRYCATEHSSLILFKIYFFDYIADNKNSIESMSVLTCTLILTYIKSDGSFECQQRQSSRRLYFLCLEKKV